MCNSTVVSFYNFSNKEKKLIQLAHEKSQKSTHQFKLGCVVYNKKILNSAVNEGCKTHPNLSGMINKLHAEMRVIKYSPTKLDRACMVVVRGTFDKPLLAKPCIVCLKQIQNVGIKKVIYSSFDGYKVINLRNFQIC